MICKHRGSLNEDIMYYIQEQINLPPQVNKLIPTQLN